MESLHLSFSRAVEAGIFKGYKIDPSTTLSHLFYADDAVFIGEWSHSNLKGIMNILRCFSLLSEFKNRDFIEFCGSKGIKREYSNARTPQQNKVAERKNRTLITISWRMLDLGLEVERESTVAFDLIRFIKQQIDEN
ncbi:RNA-directed DNA polymerase, eukaryota [Tanacetum coccineum]